MKLDLLFRSLKDLIATLLEFTELGIDFISLKDNIDMSTSAGRLMMHMLGAFAEFEASLIRERVRAGLRNAEVVGSIPIRSTKILPLGKIRKSKIEIRSIFLYLLISILVYFHRTNKLQEVTFWESERDRTKCLS